MTSSALAIAPPAVDDAAPEPRRWSLARRIAFRFLVIYVMAYIFPFPIDFIPKTGVVVKPLYEAVGALDYWVADTVLRLDVSPDWNAPSGSGDRLLDWVHVLVLLGIAAVGTAVWSVLDRRRQFYERVPQLLRIAVRYQLAFIMTSYGLAKVFVTQFPFPSPGRLVEPLGDMSPMGLLWQFMGYSPTYNVFTGSAEVLGGLLLLTRRTTTLGSLVIIGVMSNVVMLNFCYDVPVKNFSVHLLLAAVYLAAYDVRRLANLLVFNRAVPAADLGPRRSRRWLLLKIAVIGWAFYNQLDGEWQTYKEWGPGKPEPAISGVWEVESMRRNGVELPPLTTDKTRWRRLTISTRGSRVVAMDDQYAYFASKYDPAATTLTLSDGEGQVQPWVLHVARDGDELRLVGFYDLVPVEITLKKREFLLETRGFHWVNEYPYNR